MNCLFNSLGDLAVSFCKPNFCKPNWSFAQAGHGGVWSGGLPLPWAVCAGRKVCESGWDWGKDAGSSEFLWDWGLGGWGLILHLPVICCVHCSLSTHFPCSGHRLHILSAPHLFPPRSPWVLLKLPICIKGIWHIKADATGKMTQVTWRKKILFHQCVFWWYELWKAQGTCTAHIHTYISI